MHKWPYRFVISNFTPVLQLTAHFIDVLSSKGALIWLGVFRIILGMFFDNFWHPWYNPNTWTTFLSNGEATDGTFGRFHLITTHNAVLIINILVNLRYRSRGRLSDECKVGLFRSLKLYRVIYITTVWPPTARKSVSAERCLRISSQIKDGAVLWAVWWLSSY